MQYEPVTGENNRFGALKPSEMDPTPVFMLDKLHLGISILRLNSLSNLSYRGILEILYYKIYFEITNR